MNFPENKALEITTEIVVAQMSTNNLSINANSGKVVGEFFREIYNSVNEITSSIEE